MQKAPLISGSLFIVVFSLILGQSAFPINQSTSSELSHNSLSKSLMAGENFETHVNALRSLGKTGPTEITNQARLVTIAELLALTDHHHLKTVRLRGTVTRLELHLDETKHFIDFVFFLKDGKQQLLVFGRHDRTQGDIQLTTGRLVEVEGMFWKERFERGHRFENNLEAKHVSFYPPLAPDRADLQPRFVIHQERYLHALRSL